MKLLTQRFIKSVHQNNLDLGWYTDLETGKYKRKTNAEFIALMHSELSEAYESFRKDTNDDHLPKYHGTVVEIADYIIRLLDFVGCLRLERRIFEKTMLLDTNPKLHVYHQKDFSSFITDLHKRTSELLISVDEIRIDEIVDKISNILIYTFSYYMHDYDIIDGEKVYLLDHVIMEKMEYNKDRADHKIENRKKKNGKKV